MKMTEINSMEDHDLDDKLVEQREDLMKLRFQLATGALENPARVKQVKKDIARMLTVQKLRAQGAAAVVDADDVDETKTEQADD